MLNWFKAFRLRTLPLSMSGIIFGSALALIDGKWDNFTFCLAITTTLFFQILSNLANDLGDHIKGTDNDNRVGPTRAVQSGKITVKQMKIAVIIFILLSLISSLSLIYHSLFNQSFKVQLTFIVLAVLSILSAIFYTIGKKAYGYMGFGDLFVFIFFGLVSVLGVYTLYTSNFNYTNVFPAISIGLLSVAVLNLNNMRDVANDTISNKKTLVVKIGVKKAKIYHFTIIVLSFFFLVCFILIINKFILLVSLIPFLILFKHLKFISENKHESELDSQLKIVALCTFSISILFLIACLFYYL